MDLHIESPKGTQQIAVTAEGRGQRLTELMRRQGMPLNTRCGQRGLCDGCCVHLAKGTMRHIETGATVTGGATVAVQACMHHLDGDEVHLVVPERSLTSYEPQVVSEFFVSVPYAHDPLWSRTRASVPPAPQAGPPLGAAIDIGTTTVAVLIIDLDTGKTIGRAASFNRQMHLGDDVLTRINLCLTDPSLVDRLQEAIVNETISPLLDEAIRDANESRDQLVCITCAGNTTMLHLLAGVDPSAMGVSPFTPTFLEHRVLQLSNLDFRWPKEHAPAYRDAALSPCVHLLPGAAAYVGADLTAGVVASGMQYRTDTCLLVDVGTNGEIILKHGDTMLGCATAAGPAFEGGGLTDGIRAGRGAISHLHFDRDPFAIHAAVIGGDQPIGICGSAFIDFLAEGRRCGLLGPSGRFEIDALPGIDKHLTPEGECHGQGLHLAKGKGNRPIIICESDVSKLMQAKAAIAAGILTLLGRVGLEPKDVDTLLLAGGFGMHVDIDNAITCGLLPGFRREQITLVGNTSLAGALMALLDRSLLDEIAAVGRSIEIIELNLDPAFEDRYIDQLSFA